MTEYPILTELGNFFVDNLEVLLLVITPIALLITFIGKKLNDRLHSIEHQATKLLKDQEDDINRRMDNIENQLRLYDTKFKDDLIHMNMIVERIADKHDTLYKEFKTVQLNILSEFKVIQLKLATLEKNKDDDVNVTITEQPDQLKSDEDKDIDLPS